MSILKQRTGDDDVKAHAIRHIESTGSFEYCRRKLAALMAEARGIAVAMGGGIDHVEGIDRIVAMIGLNRDS